MGNCVFTRWCDCLLVENDDGELDMSREEEGEGEGETQEEELNSEVESVCSHHSLFLQDEVYEDYEFLNQYGKLITSWEDVLMGHNQLRVWTSFTFLIAFVIAYFFIIIFHFH